MMQFINIGSVPNGEDCAQVGADDYATRAHIECRAYKHQLTRMFGNGPGKARLAVKGFPHDFGTYYEVCALYDEDSEAETDWAFKIESECPEKWDDEATKELVEELLQRTAA